MMGKHSVESVNVKQLQDVIRRKDKEISNIKISLADILLQIRNLNESNNYGDASVKKRKISEICTETRYQLLIDEIDNKYEEKKIIELPTNCQGSK